jgi:hypothetical protein
MNEHLHALLKSAPGVVLKQAGIICQGIDFAHWLNMLMMGPQLDTEDIGKWVHVRKGTYKGDCKGTFQSSFLIPFRPPDRLPVHSHSTASPLS